jgi:hypothetical protein
MLQAGRSRVRVPLRCFSSINLILPATPCPWGFTQPDTNEYHEIFLSRARPARQADNLTAICEPTSHNPSFFFFCMFRPCMLMMKHIYVLATQCCYLVSIVLKRGSVLFLCMTCYPVIVLCIWVNQNASLPLFYSVVATTNLYFPSCFSRYSSRSNKR